MKRFMTPKGAIGVTLVLLMFLTAVVAPLVIPADFATRMTMTARLRPPSALHWLGTDQLGRDLLYRDRESHYIFLRHWKSEEARRAAQEDPDMLRCWARVGNEIQIVKVYETLTEVTLDTQK